MCRWDENIKRGRREMDRKINIELNLTENSMQWRWWHFFEFDKRISCTTLHYLFSHGYNYLVSWIGVSKEACRQVASWFRFGLVPFGLVRLDWQVLVNMDWIRLACAWVVFWFVLVSLGLWIHDNNVILFYLWIVRNWRKCSTIAEPVCTRCIFKSAPLDNNSPSFQDKTIPALRSHVASGLITGGGVQISMSGWTEVWS